MDYYFEPAPFYWIEDGTTQASTKKRKYNTKKKKEYVGWGSRELIEFLVSVGKDTTKALTQQEVTAVINQYVLEKNLINPAKKKRVLCDEKLQSLFGRKQSVARNKIYDLLDSHLAENKIDSDGDKSESPDDNDGYGGAVYMKQNILTSDKKTQPKKKAPSVPKSSLAAIKAENIKLVFLKKSVVQKLLKNPEAFESKVVGSFVRVKSDPHDIFQKNSHELHLVTAIVDVAPAGDKWSPLLQISRMADNVNVSELSDENFSEEEIEDLHRRVKDGLLKQPTVGELEIKVAALHEDITKHWLEKELVLLKNLIDRANEKGWRYKVLEYSDRRKLLELPAEQSRLFSEIPNVIPEEVKADPIYEGSPDDSPKAVDWDWEPFDVSVTNGVTEKPDVISEPVGQGAAEICTSNGYAHHPSSPEERNLPGTFLAALNNGRAQFIDPKEKEAPNNHEGTIQIENYGYTEFLNLNHSDIRKSENRQECNGHLQLPTPKEPEKAQVVIDLSDDDDEKEEQKTPAGEHRNRIPVPHSELGNRIHVPHSEHGNRIPVPHSELGNRIPVPHSEHGNRIPVPQSEHGNRIPVPQSEHGNRIPVPHPEHGNRIPVPHSEHGNRIPVHHPEHLAWYYFDPHGRVQGPFSLTSLKQWSDLNYFPADFKVWQIGQSPQEAVLLSQLLCTIWWSMPNFRL